MSEFAGIPMADLLAAINAAGITLPINKEVQRIVDLEDVRGQVIGKNVKYDDGKEHLKTLHAGPSTVTGTRAPAIPKVQAAVDPDGTILVTVKDLADSKYSLDIAIDTRDIEYLRGEVTDGISYAIAQLTVIAEMCARAPIMRERCDRALKALKEVRNAKE